MKTSTVKIIGIVEVLGVTYTAISSLLRWKSISVEVRAMKTPETLRTHGSE